MHYISIENLHIPNSPRALFTAMRKWRGWYLFNVIGLTRINPIERFN